MLLSFQNYVFRSKIAVKMQLESNKLKYVSHGEMSPYVKKTFKN